MAEFISNSAILSTIPPWRRAYGGAQLRPKLDFTQNLEEATDAITLGRRHSWLESEGFSLSAANADVQELPATLYP